MITLILAIGWFVVGAACGYFAARQESARYLERLALAARARKHNYGVKAREVEREVAAVALPSELELTLRNLGLTEPEPPQPASAIRWHVEEEKRLQCEAEQLALEAAAKVLREPPRWWPGGGRG
jgi:hypothetical protein